MFPDEMPVSSFPDRFPHYAWTAALSAHSDFVGSRVYACLGVNSDVHFWQNHRGLLRATGITGGGTDTKEESTQKINYGEENSPVFPDGI